MKDNGSPSRPASDDCLLGFTGFVGQALMRQGRFSDLYNSTNIANLVGQSYSTAICAAAPATMWAANSNPSTDKANLRRIADAVRQAKVERVVLISTIAVFDDPAAGYTESAAQYETKKAYGRHRRELELELGEHVERLHVIRLPALFGMGLKKNFIFDLINPVPSFVRPEAFERVYASLGPEASGILRACYRHRPDLEMWELDRSLLEGSGERPRLEHEFERHGLAARNFTNCASRLQYYNVDRLAADIEWAIQQEIAILNICSEPLLANEICLALTGRAFEAASAPVYSEDMRSDHAARFGSRTPYLYGRDIVLGELKAFYTAATAI